MRQYNVEGQGIFTSLLDSVIYYVDAVRFSVDNECAQTAYDIASILRRRGFEEIRLDKDGGEFANPAPRPFASSPVGEQRMKDEGREKKAAGMRVSSPVEVQGAQETGRWRHLKERFLSREAVSILSAGLLAGIMTAAVGFSWLPAALFSIFSFEVTSLIALGMVLFSFMGIITVLGWRLWSGETASWKEKVKPAVSGKNAHLLAGLSAAEQEEVELRLIKESYKMFKKSQQGESKIKYTRRLYSRYGTISMPLAVLTGAGEMLLHSFWWFFAMKPSGRFGFVALKLQDNWFEKLVDSWQRTTRQKVSAQDHIRGVVAEVRSGSGWMKAGVIGWLSRRLRALWWQVPMLASMVDFTASRLTLYIVSGILIAGAGRIPLGRGVYSMGCPGTSLEAVRIAAEGSPGCPFCRRGRFETFFHDRWDFPYDCHSPAHESASFDQRSLQTDTAETHEYGY